MENNNMSIKEVKVEKGILGTKIGKLISDFEKETGVIVEHIGIKQRFEQIGDVTDVVTVEVVVKL